MDEWEAIFAVKVYEPWTGGEIIPRNTPAYHISRRRFKAISESEARDKCREARHTIEDAFTQARTLSLSTTIGAEVPKYQTW